MFDTLTEAERHALYGKLGDWAHRFAEIGLPLSYVALANHDDRGLQDALWVQRDRYYGAMNDLHEVMNTDLAAV